MVAIYQYIIFYLGIHHLVVAVERGIGHSIHDYQCCPKAVPGKAVEVIILYRLIFIDHTDTAGIGLSIAQKVIVFYEGTLPMTHGQGAAAFEEDIVAVYVTSRFIGNDLKLPAAAVEIVSLYQRMAIRQ